jgi:hypothetical protein
MYIRIADRRSTKICKAHTFKFDSLGVIGTLIETRNRFFYQFLSKITSLLFAYFIRHQFSDIFFRKVIKTTSKNIIKECKICDSMRFRLLFPLAKIAALYLLFVLGYSKNKQPPFFEMDITFQCNNVFK